jgi:hypothetical protein
MLENPEFRNELLNEHLIPILAETISEKDIPADATDVTLRQVIEARMADPEHGRRFKEYATKLAAVWIGLEGEARTTLAALGYPPHEESIRAYRRFFHVRETLLRPDLRAIIDAVLSDIERIEEEHRRSPPSSESEHRDETSGIRLSASEFEDWAYGLLNLAGVRLIHERALATRLKYLRLARVTKFPSKSIFQAELDVAMQSRQAAEKDAQQTSTEWAIGHCAAEASERALKKYEELLKEVDTAIRPRGSYLSPRTAPKQIQIRKEVAHWLRLALGDHGSEIARSKAIGAALRVFGRGLVFMSYGGTAVAAINIVQREKNRLPEGLAKDIAERFERAARRRKWIEGLQ